MPAREARDNIKKTLTNPPLLANVSETHRIPKKV
jgi:hypothetical protein